MADFRPQIGGNVDATATIEGISLTKFASTGTVSSVPDTTITLVHTQTYVSGTFENLVIVSCSGSANAKFTLYKNTVLFDTKRSTPQRNVSFDFTGAPLALATGDVIDVKVEHFNTGVLETFEATIYGYPA